MKTKNKLAFGTVLASIGGISIILGPSLGFTHMDEPWSFIIGFVTGVICGIGTVLAISGLIEK